MWCGTFLTLLVSLLVVQEESGTSAQECGGSLYQDSGTVTSPNYPSSFPNNQKCAWTITVAEDKVVFLSFKLVELSSQWGTCLDSVQVYDGEHEKSLRLIELCGFKNQSQISAFGHILRSSGNKMYITFTSDNSTGGRGFIATFESQECNFKYGIDVCNNPCICVQENSIRCNNTNGICACKPGWTSNDCSQAQCKDLKCPYVCVVTSTDPWTEECQCPPYMKATTNKNSPCVDRYPCGSTIREQSGYLASPGFPSGYSKNLYCSWTIYGGSNTVITLGFEEFEVCDPASCSSSHYVKVHDGPSTGYSQLGHYTRTYAPQFVRSTGYRMHIVFKTNGNEGGRGFKAYFTSQECASFTYGVNCTNCSCNRDTSQSCDQFSGACVCKPGWSGKQCTCDQYQCYSIWPPSNTILQGCSQTLTNSSGRFTSPGYPTYYASRTACNWTIEAPENHKIKLMFPNFNMVKSSKCSDGSLRVHDGGPSGHLIGEFCSTEVPYMIRSSGNTMFVDFKSSHSSSKVSGFLALYETYACSQFTFGDTCELNCQCVQERTEFCDSFTGVCVCKSGWMGSNCSQDIDECQFPEFYECPSNSFCVNKQGNFSCNCSQGYIKNTTGLCIVDTICKYKKCSHSCIKIGKHEKCLCPDDYLELDSSRLKCVVPYYPFGEPASDLEVSATNSNKAGSRLMSDTIKFSTGAPFGDCMETEARIYFDGVISFGDGEPPHAPNWTEARVNRLKLLAPFWTVIKMSAGKMFYHLYEKCGPEMFYSTQSPAPKKAEVIDRARKDVKRIHNLADFDVNTVLLATWDSVQPPPTTSKSKSQRNLNNTFQAVYVSGYPKRRDKFGVVTVESEKSYAIYIYQNGQMNWPQPTERRPVNTGCIVNGNLTDLGTNGIDLDGKAWTADYEGIISLPTGQVETSLRNCHNHVCDHAHLMTSTSYQNEIKQLHHCPCALSRIGPQWVELKTKRSNNIYCFTLSDVAKRRLFSNNPRNKICCYQGSSKQQASYLSAPAKDAGHVLTADFSKKPDNNPDLWAHQQCCSGSDTSECDRFYRVFPDMGCSNIFTFVSARAVGDPHIITLDWVNYTMNGLGEYMLMDVPDENFVLQARTGVALTADGDETSATVFTSFAAEDADIHFQVELTTSLSSMVIYVGKEDVTSDFYADTDFRISTENISVVREVASNKTTVKATFACGVAIKVVVGVRSLDITLEVDKLLQNKTRGLLGNFNGDPDDDFLLPDGTVLSSSMTEREIFYLFAKKYELTPSTSVFLYFGGESTDDYQHPAFVPIFKDEIDEATLAAAEETCQGSSSCLFDFAVTKDEEFAVNSRDSQNEIESIHLNSENCPPTISAINGDTYDGHFWVVTVGTSSALQIVAADDDGDAISFNIDNPPSDELTLDNNGSLTYTPSRSPIKSVSIRVHDAKGAYSEYRNIAVKTCTGCNGHGTCDATLTRTIRTGGVDFQFMKCNCLPAYSGDDCDLDRDGCASKPCSPGQECTDIPAEDQGDGDIGFECGECPPGFLRTNITCDLDIDECSDSTLCQQICINTYGSYVCSCEEGYRLNSQDKRTCLDVDECEEKISGCEQGCINSDGSFSCTCASGHTLNKDGRTCKIVEFFAAACKHCEQICSIANFVPICGCRLGYQVDPSDETKCLDVDECDPARKNPCSQACVNTYGGFECDCSAGYKLDRDGISCIECTSPFYGYNCYNTCSCFGRGSCNSVTGCVCNKGWSGVNCDEDVDECLLQSNVCPDGQVCQNEQGSFSCVCASGYHMENRVCVDINECTDPLVKADCDERLETCVNTDGSYKCECKPGYKLGDAGKCIDIDECQQEGHGCEQICVNKPGTYSCKCQADFKLSDDRRTCYKPCKCVQKNVDFCNTTNGHCTCKLGWTGNDCSVDIDECLSNPCPEHLECNNLLNGQHACLCFNGAPPANDGSCKDCNRTITDSSGLITTSNFPGNYDNNSFCTWTIFAPDSRAVVVLSFLNHDVEGRPFDYVEVHDGPDSQAKLLGASQSEGFLPSVVESSTNVMHMVFVSDESVSKTGFRASYSEKFHCKYLNCSHICNVTVTNPWMEQCVCPEWMTLDPSDGSTCNYINDCGSTLTELTGIIVSPDYPNPYPDNSFCFWVIKGNESDIVSLRITDLEVEVTENCAYDHLAVADGNNEKAPQLGQYCGNNPGIVESTGPSMYIVFRSDQSLGLRGFKATYTLIGKNATEP